jgi:hypothetical protein
MPSPAVSPYRTLPVERRVDLVTRAISANKQNRAVFTQRLVARPGGFRAVTLNSWSAEKLAREIVRLRAETASDELDLLQMLYVELEPGIQVTFFDAVGVRHEKGQIAEGQDPPFADIDGVRRGAEAVKQQHGDDGMRYLRTLVRYNLAWWPGLDAIVAELDA